MAAWRGSSDATPEEGIELTSSAASSEVNEGEAPFSLADTKILTTHRYHRSSNPLRRFLVYILIIIGTALALSVVLVFKGKAGLPSHAAFEIETVNEIPEDGSILMVYKHLKTDAKLTALVPRNPTPGMDKAFGIGFRTRPTSSNGVAHVLEHSVLCGSKKFMAKDPFTYLVKGSLQTFANAFTYSDRSESCVFIFIIEVYQISVFPF